MKILKYLVTGLVGILALLGLVVGVSIFVMEKMPAVKDGYYEDVEIGGELEAIYTARGSYEVTYTELEPDNVIYERYSVWYPVELEESEKTYPMVIMVNGTGVKASKYSAILEHLASWGFIVVGDEYENSWSGAAPSASLDFMLARNEDTESIFCGKIDVDNIGVAGHSQGGVGVINAVTNRDNKDYYKAMYTASMTHLELANELRWTYDVSGVKIPYFMVAGTLQVDAGDGARGSENTGIAPLWSLQDNYAAIAEDVPKVLARRKNTDHRDMLYKADGYMTAWFMYWLNGDEEAGNVFFGDAAEILVNDNWQDATVNK